MTPDDVFVGSPPLAFTFGLGGLAIFPLRFGAAATLLENASPANMIEIIETYQGDDQLHGAHGLPRDDGGDGRRRRSVLAAHRRLGRRDLAGAGLRRLDCAKTGKPILDGIGATEMLHIFISNRLDDWPPGCDRQAGARLRGQDRRRRDEGGAARHGGPARRARPDRLPLSRRRAPAQLRARRLEPHRRFLRAGRGGLLPLRRARRTT